MSRRARLLHGGILILSTLWCSAAAVILAQRCCTRLAENLRGVEGGQLFEMPPLLLTILLAVSAAGLPEGRYVTGRLSQRWKSLVTVVSAGASLASALAVLCFFLTAFATNARQVRWVTAAAYGLGTIAAGSVALAGMVLGVDLLRARGNQEAEP